jgi:magnesium-transporting ATPase (P-type)
LNKEEFRKIVKTLRVVASSKPFDKYLLVLGLKEEENIVAVTGNGTIDAPSLSKASVGFAMKDGTDIAQLASDIIILDNNFASIVTAVLCGRNIYDSVRKLIQFQLTVITAGCVIIFVSVCIGNETPLTVIQLLWVSMIIDTLGSLALSTESPYQVLLKRKPYPKDEYIINWLMWKHIICQSLVLIGIVLFLYIYGPYFIVEDNLHRIAESNILLKCFGTIPGRGYDNGVLYILDGSSSNWSNSAMLKHTVAECGRYANSSNLLSAFHIYVNAYGNTSHMTIIFNVFVLYVLCNQICSRFLEDQINIFNRIFINPLFIVITVCEFGLQAILIQYGSVAFHTSFDGLTAYQWRICWRFSIICFFVNFVIKFIPIEKYLQAIWMSVRYRNRVQDTENAPENFEMANSARQMSKKSHDEFALKKKLTSIHTKIYIKND